MATKEISYNGYVVRYDTEALGRAIDGLEFGDDGTCGAVGMMACGAEVHLVVHDCDDWYGCGTDEDDALHLPASELMLHTEPDNGDGFILVGIGGYSAEVEKAVRKSGTIPLWVRAGMTWNVTSDELEVLLGGDYVAIGKLFSEAVRTGKAFLDGETYIPEAVLDDESLREKLTSREISELAEKSWDCYPE